MKAKLLVIGESYDKAELNGPFESKEGVFFKAAMMGAGIDPKNVGFAYLGAGCSTVRMAQERFEASFVVLSGSRVLQSLRGDLRTSECHGRAMTMDPEDFYGPLVMPVVNHWALFRAARWRQDLIDDLKVLKQIGRDPANWVSYTPDTCVKCRGEFFAVDDWGVTYCEEHWQVRGFTINHDAVKAINEAFGASA